MKSQSPYAKEGQLTSDPAPPYQLPPLPPKAKAGGGGVNGGEVLDGLAQGLMDGLVDGLVNGLVD